jgi:hypothetical protein
VPCPWGSRGSARRRPIDRRGQRRGGSRGGRAGRGQAKKAMSTGGAGVGLKGGSEPEAEAPGAKQQGELGDGRV